MMSQKCQSRRGAFVRLGGEAVAVAQRNDVMCRQRANLVRKPNLTFIRNAYLCCANDRAAGSNLEKDDQRLHARHRIFALRNAQ